jgi:hypothetical protein
MPMAFLLGGMINSVAMKHAIHCEADATDSLQVRSAFGNKVRLSTVELTTRVSTVALYKHGVRIGVPSIFRYSVPRDYGNYQ